MNRHYPKRMRVCIMGILSHSKRKQKNTQVVLKSNTSLERAANSILGQRGKQIVDGLNKPTASTGTPMDKLHGGQKGWLKCQT